MSVVVPFDPDEVGRRFGETPPAPLPRGNGHLEDPEPVEEDEARIAELDEIAARETEARSLSSTARRLYRLADLANLTSAAEDYVIGGGILTRKGKLLAYAPPGKGKTTFADHLCACLASGRSFLGRFPVDRARRVLMIQAELAESELASHGQALLQAFAKTPATDNLVFLLDSQMRLPRHREELRALIHDGGFEIVGFDPALEFFEGESSDKAEQVGKMLSAIDWLLEEEPQLAGAIVIHHQNVAGGRTSGSWKFEGWPSTILRLEPVPGIATDRMVVFEKIRAPGFSVPEKLQIRLGDAGYLPIAGESKLPEGKTELVVHLMREAGGQLRRQDLARPQATVLLNHRKLSWIGDRIAVIDSGSFLDDGAGDLRYELAPGGDPQQLSVPDVLPRIRNELERRSTMNLEPHPTIDPDVADVYEVIVAGGHAGARPQLFVMRGDGAPPQELEGRIVLTGMLRGWARRRGHDVVLENPARTVEEALRLTVTTLDEAIRDLYRLTGRERLEDFFPDGLESGSVGQVPPVAFPVHVAVITATEAVEYVVEDRQEAVTA